MAKKDLVGRVQAPLQDGRPKVAEPLPLAEELATFRVEVTQARDETFEAWRERDHDDLVLAVPLSLYAAVRGEWRVCV